MNRYEYSRNKDITQDLKITEIAITFIGNTSVFSKFQISPKNQYFWNPEKPAIFDLNRSLPEVDKPAVAKARSRYPFHKANTISGSYSLNSKLKNLHILPHPPSAENLEFGGQAYGRFFIASSKPAYHDFRVINNLLSITFD